LDLGTWIRFKLIMAIRVRQLTRGLGFSLARRATARTRAFRFNSTAAEGKTASPPPPPPKGGSSGFGTFAALAIVAGAGYYGYTQYYADGSASKESVKRGFADYQEVYNSIAKKIEDEDDYDDGSYAPVLLRLAWHSSGTFDVNKGDGGSGPGTMRFDKEVGYPANAGLQVAKKFLEPLQEKYPWISSGDLYTLAGVAAVQEMGGPSIKWRAGRIDAEITKTTVDGRLPDASQGQKHVRDIFYRMGFNDQEIVALIGAHALGRCHSDRSGYEGPWTFSPTVFTNDFYTLLLNEKWSWKKWKGPAQYEDEKTKSLMMLPADMAIVQDKEFKKWAVKYANDQELFFKDFAAAYSKLLELGVPYEANTPYWEFKRING
jgi:cytochrome c peroxidase